MKLQNRNGVLGLETAKQVMVTFLILAVTAIAVLLSLTALDDSIGDTIDISLSPTVTVLNETGAYVNISGYTLSGYNSTWSSMSVDAVWANAIPGAGVGTPYLIPSANYTLSSVGVLTNATQVDNSTEYDNANVSYNYLFSIDSGTVTSIIGNISAGLVTFFASTGTIFSIL
ncbi:hypothetical protein LCGC14_0868820, partial [marine sediment metagenome]